MAILGVMVIVAKIGPRWAQLWFGTHLALRDSGLPPLAPLCIIGLGQKGPDWPADCSTWPLGRVVQTAAYSPQAVEAVGGLNGPRPPNERGWPKDDGDG
ncbi:hypothetical protein O181_110120 [Austropuccinia psidii MF-1]|uniref:Uncharacterized protein n=1 Tax=Austropuccinia psidii MF-1 TaxID=1389203 RepID=A0A9Q3JVR0_9BASI|nr:hypothetical protein [Austropuccinia psidii MF-1]